MLVPRDQLPMAEAIAKATAEAWVVGDPFGEGSNLGPLVSDAQRDRVRGYIEKGVEEGAKLVLGGGRPAHLDKGWFVEPTMFVDVDNSMTIAQEEIFGPVLVVIPFEDDDDAVRIANDSAYGLSGAVYSASLDRALGIARRVRTGSMNVNGGAAYGADVPFGGYKASGVGRQNGVSGFDQYLEVKSVAWPAAAGS
jgi:aldehyde dehydrogenase (NAD+)